MTEEQKPPIRIAVIGTGHTATQAALLLAAVARQQKNIIICDEAHMDDKDRTAVLGTGLSDSIENLRLNAPACVFSIEDIYRDKFMWPRKERRAWKRGSVTSRFVREDIRRNKRKGYNIATREMPRSTFMLESKWWSQSLNKQLREGSIQEPCFRVPDYRTKWVWHPVNVARNYPAYRPRYCEKQWIPS